MGILDSAWEEIEDFGTSAWGTIKDAGQGGLDATKHRLKRKEDLSRHFLKGEFSEGWGDFEDSFGEHQRMTSANLGDTGLVKEDAWYTQNSDTIAAAIAAMYFGGSALAGGEGGASGGAAGAGGGVESGASTAFDWTGMFDTGGEYLETANDWYGNYLNAEGMYQGITGDGVDSPAQSSGQNYTAMPRGQMRSSSYDNLIGRLSGLTQQIDPFEEIILPTGERY